MRVAGLFAGIGGFELGFEGAGHETHMLCEILPAAQAVLSAHFDGVPVAPDIRNLKSLPADVDLLCAGFPCQDLSQAGRTRGLDGAQSGLIGEVFRLLRKRRIPWVVVENVPFMLQLQGGEAMRRITNELEALGYRWAYRVLDTFSFGLPQRRERVFLVATVDGNPADVLLAEDNPLERPATDITNIAHGFYWTEGRGGLGWAADAVPTLKNGSTIGIPSPPAVLLPDGCIVKPDIRDAERLQGFPIDWTKPAEGVDRRSKRWGLVGSAVSVPVAEWLGRALTRPGRYQAVDEQSINTRGKLPRAAYGGPGFAARAVSVSTDPVGIRPKHLHEFLRFPGDPLSAKATGGFYLRTQVAKLRFPEGFLDAVRRHLTAMQSIDVSAAGRSSNLSEPRIQP